jgi:hypothetical protein
VVVSKAGSHKQIVAIAQDIVDSFKRPLSTSGRLSRCSVSCSTR